MIAPAYLPAAQTASAPRAHLSWPITHHPRTRLLPSLLRQVPFARARHRRSASIPTRPQAPAWASSPPASVLTDSVLAPPPSVRSPPPSSQVSEQGWVVGRGWGGAHLDARMLPTACCTQFPRVNGTCTHTIHARCPLHTATISLPAAATTYSHHCELHAA